MAGGGGGVLLRQKLLVRRQSADISCPQDEAGRYAGAVEMHST